MLSLRRLTMKKTTTIILIKLYCCIDNNLVNIKQRFKRKHLNYKQYKQKEKKMTSMHNKQLEITVVF